MARDENMIAALKRERATYVAAGDEDRVRQVDESLRHYGYKPEPDAEDGPQQRTTAPQQTADTGSGPGAGDSPAQTGAPAKKTAARKTAPAVPPATPPAV